MTREQLSGIITDLDNQYIVEAHTYDPARRNRSPERNGIMKTRRIITLALAAALILTMTVVAYAAYGAVAGPEAAEKVALEQIEEWKALGLLSRDVHFDGPADYIQEVEARQGSSYWYGRLFPHCYDVRFHSGKYNGQIHVDTLTGKIIHVILNAHPDETEKPVATKTADVPIDPDDLSKGYRPNTSYLSYNFDDIFPADLTVDRFCSLLAEYWGFSGYRIAETVDGFYGTDFEAIDGSTLLKDLPKSNPTNYYLTVFFEGDQVGTPMYIQLDNFPEYVSLVLGNHHNVG